MGEAIDLGVGFELAVVPGAKVVRGEPLGTVHARDEAGLEAGRRILRGAVVVGDEPAPLRRLVSHRVTAEGVEELP